MPITAYKGFNSDWTCRDHQFEVGKTYKLEGEPEICVHGFHACLNPMDVFGYYAPGQSKFAVVEVPDHVEEHEGDTKICGVEITIKAEMSLPEFIGKGVEYLLSKVKWDEAKESNTGNYSAATNTGYQSAATVEGQRSVAMASGYEGRASASEGSAIFLVDRDDEGEILHVFAGIAGRDDIKPGTFYTLKDGKPVEV